MNKTDRISIIGILAGVIFLSGCILSIVAILHYPAAKRQLIKDAKVSAELDKLSLQFSELENQIEPLAEINYSNLPTPRAVIENILDRADIEKLEENIESLGNGYSINRIELTAKNIELKELPGLIRTLELMRPPLRVVACEITAAPDKPGRGKIQLEMERIQH
jgi:hypothetical protein